ncbi:hypothetical protein L1987_45823 [Smallanthus sonchifolius]|uniref:Uncharacterized protein n=1 Tax=Smallanthus sonchifolius TaxID=185202 RepID=A0ACB9FXX8_9ASTR|nr:hypothetical protein L1987_45823 [Smallanthus sonchifolius]
MISQYKWTDAMRSYKFVTPHVMIVTVVICYEVLYDVVGCCIMFSTADSDQPVVDPPKRRGPNINRSATKTLENLPKGSKISLTIATGTKVFVGPSLFATKCGIVMHNVCPLNFHKWESIPDDVKDQMYEKLQVKFNLKNESAICKITNETQMQESRRLEAYLRLLGVRVNSANHIFHMTDRETQMPPSPFEVYHQLHFNAQKQGWQNDDTRRKNILHHKAGGRG